MLAAHLIEDADRIDNAIIFYTMKDDANSDVDHRLRVYSSTREDGVPRGFLSWAAAMFLRWVSEDAEDD